MKHHLRIALAQLNLTVGDISGNLEKHIHAAIKARDEQAADIIVFPELSLTGYPPEDLLLRKNFIDEANAALLKFLSEIKNIYCLVGHPLKQAFHCMNACSLVYNGEILGQYSKKHLPNYGVFDEYRYFSPENKPCIVDIKGIPTGLVICEDLWQKSSVRNAAACGAKLILSPNASPFEIDKHDKRVAVLTKRIRENHVPIVYVNNIGGQDEIIFDGGSMVMDRNANICHFAGFFNETISTFDLDIDSSLLPEKIELPSSVEKVYQALVTGVRDYIEKNHFPGVLIGVSGGIDSALTLAIAVDALGKDRVKAVLMPSRYTSERSMQDAHAVVNACSVASETISIEPSYSSFLESLSQSFANKKADVTEENIQARCRAVILMALSNKSGSLVLTTGNRSELAVGYCTLYGDMAGGYAVIKDIPKTLVYELANYRNSVNSVIPQETINRAPTAELAFDQKDEDSLPPYAILDQILECYLNKSESIDEIVAKGFDEETVKKVVRLIRNSEYKRKQAALGPRINHKSFGKDWRYPVTNGFKG